MSKPAKFISILYDVLEVIVFIINECSNKLTMIALVGRKTEKQYKF